MVPSNKIIRNNESGIILKDSPIGHHCHRISPPVSPPIQPFIYTHQDTDTPTLPPPIHSPHTTTTHKLQPINYNINGTYNQHRKFAYQNNHNQQKYPIIASWVGALNRTDNNRTQHHNQQQQQFASHTIIHQPLTSPPPIQQLETITDDHHTHGLDALGNATAATGKGFAIGSAVLTALALLAAFKNDSGQHMIQHKH